MDWSEDKGLALTGLCPKIKNSLNETALKSTTISFLIEDFTWS